MRPNQPDFLPLFPPPCLAAPPDTPVICRPRASVTTTPMLVSLSAYGQPDLSVVVNATRGRFAYRQAIRWARKKVYGDKRITAVSIGFAIEPEVSA